MGRRSRRDRGRREEDRVAVTQQQIGVAEHAGAIVRHAMEEDDVGACAGAGVEVKVPGPKCGIVCGADFYLLKAGVVAGGDFFRGGARLVVRRLRAGWSAPSTAMTPMAAQQRIHMVKAAMSQMAARRSKGMW